jgi:hypothetical protein
MRALFRTFGREDAEGFAEARATAYEAAHPLHALDALKLSVVSDPRPTRSRTPPHSQIGGLRGGAAAAVLLPVTRPTSPRTQGTFTGKWYVTDGSR